MFYTRPNKTESLRVDPESCIVNKVLVNADKNPRLGVTAASREWE